MKVWKTAKFLKKDKNINMDQLMILLENIILILVMSIN